MTGCFIVGRTAPLNPLTEVYAAFGVDHEAFAFRLSVSCGALIYLDVSVFSSSARKKRHMRRPS